MNEWQKLMKRKMNCKGNMIFDREKKVERKDQVLSECRCLLSPLPSLIITPKCNLTIHIKMRCKPYRFTDYPHALTTTWFLIRGNSQSSLRIKWMNAWSIHAPIKIHTHTHKIICSRKRQTRKKWRHNQAIALTIAKTVLMVMGLLFL